ncbi:MAG TPA: hypothetical protein VK974_01610 [Methylophilaceae bacterium]|nr:hypothetical protein [Methylophilaceae bacterium]
MKPIFTICLFTAITLTACSPPDKTPKIAESQREALDKAKAVEATVNQQTDEQKKQLEQQSE